MRKTIATFIAAIFTSGLLAQYIAIEEAPQWAVVADVEVNSNVNSQDVQNGFYYTSFDQISHTPSHSYFTRYKVKVLNRSGIDYFSQISIPIDTSFQKVIFHSYKLVRDGEETDRTRNLELSLINHEEQLDQNVLNGIMLVNGILEDIRRDDEIELSYSIIGQNPIYEGHLHDIIYLESTNHIDYLRYKLIFPKDSVLQVKIHDDSSITIKKYVTGSDSIYEVTAKNIQPVFLEETMSLSSNPFNYLEYSSHDNWMSVKKWAQQIFQPKETSFIDSLYKAIVKNEKELTRRATLLLDYVQNNIRYTSVNGGIGSYLPSSPSKIIKRNYGDCKDKTLLAVQLLKRAGVDYAYPALVNTISGKSMIHNMAGHRHFDHALIKAKINGKIIWLDPTISLQGGKIIDRHAHFYGYALVINEDENGVEKMEIDFSRNKTEVIETFDVSNPKGEGKLIVQTKRLGRNADYMRSLMDYYSVREIAKSFKEVYSTVFFDVTESKTINIYDDYDSNVITMEENYRIRDPWEEVEEYGQTGYLLRYEPMNLYNYVYPLACDKKKYQIDLDNPGSFYQLTRFKLPEDAIYRLNNFKTENSTYTFTKEQKIIDTSTTETLYNFSYKTTQIKPEKFLEYCEDVNNDARNLQLNIVWMED